MTLSTQEELFVQTLLHSYNEGVPLAITDAQAIVTDLKKAYEVQQKVCSKKTSPLGAYKISLTSERTQKLFDSNEPLYGAETVSQLLSSPATVSLQSYLEPLVEIELVFTAKEELSPEDDLHSLANKLMVSPGIELPDSRFKEWFPDLNKYLVVSDGAVGGSIIYGQEQEASTLSIDQYEEIKGTLFFDDCEVSSGISTEVLGNPLLSVQWLVKKLAKTNQRIVMGTRISSGTFIFPVPLKQGTFKATYSHGIGEVSVTVTK